MNRVPELFNIVASIAGQCKKLIPRIGQSHQDFVFIIVHSVFLQTKQAASDSGESLTAFGGELLGYVIDGRL